ncbi:PEP-CTERM sorting domain-containing protein [Methylomonas sp. 11b]|uniref:PEP-CTERM sorting domain-containing protein n=1 Tax=Methylomonas sp. 11b TaxID=1168169 RepID=UPI0012DCDD6E|nr:PEP-CTERM sorting domain-containing protein [Methylomonas sp. 11b]
MKNKQRFLASMFALGLPMSAHASTVVTFEDISPNDLADGYGGISGWSALGSVGIADKDLGGNGHKALYGHEGMISFDHSPVVFQGTYYKAYAVPQDEFPLVAIELWYQGAMVHNLQYLHSPLGLEWLASGYSGLIDKIYFRGGLEGFSIDDLSYDSVSSVPLPASWAMFAGGAAMLGFARRRDRSAISKSRT